MRKFILPMILASLMQLGGINACDPKGGVPAGSDQGDSAGDNQPAQKCQPQPIQIQPVTYQAPEVHEYFIIVSLEDEDCGDMNLKNKAHIERSGAFQSKEGGTSFMVWDDGKSGIVNTELPYHTRGIVEKSRPHNVHVVVTMAVTIEMMRAGAVWLTCQIERDHRIVDSIGEVGLARVAITNPGPHTVQCRAFR